MQQDIQTDRRKDSYMTKNRFKLLFAYRNISNNKKNSLVVILTLSLVFCLLLLILGMNFTFGKIYEFEASNKYEDIDIVITYDEYSSSRLINKRYVTDDFSDRVDYSLSFFNLSVLIDSETDVYYANLMSSLSHEFEILIDEDVDIEDSEAIITESYAKEYGLSIGDSLTFTILNKDFTYQVVDIYQDKGLFSDISFFINKEALFNEIYGLGNLTNFGNALYVYVENDVDIDELIVDIKANDNLSNYNTFPTLDWEFIENKAMDLSSMMLALGLIVMLAMLMVLDSLFPIINRTLRQEMGVTNTLGADKRFLWHVNLLQWMIYLLIAFVFGLIFAFCIINLGVYVYGLKGFIPVKLSTMGIALGLASIFIVLRAFLGFKKESRLSVASQSKNRRFLRYRTRYLLVGISAVVLVLEWLIQPFIQEIHSLIIVVASLYLTLNLTSILLVSISSLLEKGKKQSVFKIFQLKYLKTNKHIHQSLRVIFICLLSLVLIFSVRGFLYQELDEFQDTMDFDLAIVNIYDYDDDLQNEMSEYNLASSESAIFYTDIVVHFDEENLQPSKFFVSMDYSEFGSYFNLPLEEIDMSYIFGDGFYTILPENFKYVYDLDIGDVVTLDLNYNLEGIDVEIAGFFDTNFDNIIFSNLMYVDEYQSDALPNSIFIRTDDTDQVFKDLVDSYSAKLYYVLNPDVYFDSYIESAENVTDFLMVFSFFMIVCFVIIIFNNTVLVFYGLKSDLAKLKVLGANKKTFILSLVKEYILFLSVVILVGYLEIQILSIHLKYIVLFTDYYKDISSTPLTIAYGCAIVGVVLIASYSYYFRNIKAINISEEIKIF